MGKFPVPVQLAIGCPQSFRWSPKGDQGNALQAETESRQGVWPELKTMSRS